MINMAGKTAVDVIQLAKIESQFGNLLLPSSNTCRGGLSPKGPHGIFVMVPFEKLVVSVLIITYFLKAKQVQLKWC